jgi:hypothetical protein
MCGCFYWHEWFSHKPQCCDPCNQCGSFTCSHNPYVEAGPPYSRFGAIYSDGTGTSSSNASGRAFPPAAGGPTPAEVPPATPTPAGETDGVFDGYAPEATPSEEMPSEELPPGPTTTMPRPVRMTSHNGPVDSTRYSRTLGRPPRRGLFTR